MLRLSKAELQRMLGKERVRELGEKKPEKYRNRKCKWMGITFASIRERDRYIFLSAEAQAGRIHNLRRQVKFQLIPKQYVNGKLVERECAYIADFVYTDPYGVTVVEDAKGMRTREYIAKRKMMLEKYGIQIREV